MSDMIKCDRCGRMMYTDSRSPKGAYWKITADGITGFHVMHLCRNCYSGIRVTEEVTGLETDTPR